MSVYKNTILKGPFCFFRCCCRNRNRCFDTVYSFADAGGNPGVCFNEVSLLHPIIIIVAINCSNLFAGDVNNHCSVRVLFQ